MDKEKIRGVDQEAPPSTTVEGFRRLVLETAKPKLESRRNFILAGLAGTVAVVEGFALAAMAPLKEKVPYFVEVEKSSGKVNLSEQAATQFRVEEKHIRYFLKEWMTNLLTVDTRSRDYLLPASFAFLRGQAKDQWQEWVTTRDKPLVKLAESPSYRREARFVSTTFIAEGVALIRALLLETGAKGGLPTPQSYRKQITVYFTLIPPETDEEALKNPIGINITRFTIDDELA